MVGPVLASSKFIGCPDVCRIGGELRYAVCNFVVRNDFSGRRIPVNFGLTFFLQEEYDLGNPLIPAESAFLLR